MKSYSERLHAGSEPLLLAAGSAGRRPALLQLGLGLQCCPLNPSIG